MGSPNPDYWTVNDCSPYSRPELYRLALAAVVMHGAEPRLVALSTAIRVAGCDGIQASDLVEWGLMRRDADYLWVVSELGKEFLCNGLPADTSSNEPSA